MKRNKFTNYFITVVYYSTDGVGVFHVVNANTESLQKNFNEHDVCVIKNITIEYKENLETKFKTLFTELDIQKFLTEWEIDFL
ncbi:hypothetical protein ABE073_04225 [Lederbergia citrisecunda]|uniref:hypothetical protein n=1 Tax=Lederbergia citrisecunda TaxID=2833583 RepID=UPI003D2DA07E